MRGENNPFYGKHHTAEAIERSRQANLGRTPWNKGMKGVIHHTDETRAKMREAHLGQTPWNKGKKYSRKTAAQETQMTP